MKKGYLSPWRHDVFFIGINIYGNIKHNFQITIFRENNIILTPLPSRNLSHASIRNYLKPIISINSMYYEIELL